jgi:hypothetical protein
MIEWDLTKEKCDIKGFNQQRWGLIQGGAPQFAKLV